jgi:hypothetical protein
MERRVAQVYMRLNKDRKDLKKEDLLRHAIDLSFRFEVAGPIVPYRGSLVPPAGPQLFASPPPPPLVK